MNDLRIKKKTPLEFVEESPVHLTDKKPGTTVIYRISFNRWWKLMVTWVVLFPSYYCFTLLAYWDCNDEKEKQTLINVWSSKLVFILVSCEMFNIIDTCLMIWCKIRRYHPSVNYSNWFLLIDVISCIPAFTIYYIPPQECKIPFLIVLVSTIRFFKIIEYISIVLQSFRIRVKHILTIIALLYWVAFFTIDVVYKSLLEVTGDFMEITMDSESDAKDFIHSLLITCHIYAPIEGFGEEYNYKPNTYGVMFVIVATMWLVWLVVGLQTIPAIYLVNKWRKHYLASFPANMPCRPKYTRTESAPERVMDRGIRINWIADREKNKLQEPLRLDICLHYHYSAIYHCEFLKDLDPGFLRALASSCLVRKYREDQIIIDEGDFKDSMIFIEKGTVGFADPGTSKTPIFFLDAGSLIGEVSLTRVYLNKYVMTCETETCELLILPREGLLKLYPLFSKQIEITTKAINDRFIRAHKFLFYHKYVMIGHPKEALWKLPEERFVWVHNALFYMKNARARTLATEDPKYEWDPSKWRLGFHDQMPEHLGRLPLYLAKLVPIKFNKIVNRAKPLLFKRKGFLPIIHPKSAIFQVWEYIFVAISIIFLFYWPMRLLYGFDTKIYTFPHLTQATFILDFMFYLFTAETNFDGLLMENFIENLYKKIYNENMWKKFLCAIPVDFIILNDKGLRLTYLYKHMGLFQTHQLLCIPRIQAAVNTFKRKFIRDIMIMEVIQSIMVFLYYSYSSGIAMLLATCFNDECDKKGWYYIETGKTSLNHTWTEVGAGIRRGIATVIDINRTLKMTFSSNELLEVFYTAAFALAGSVIKVYICVVILAAIITRQSHSYSWAKSKQRLLYYLYSKNVKLTTLMRVVSFMEFKWKCTSLQQPTKTITGRENWERFEIIFRHPLFRWMDKQSIIQLLTVTQSCYFPPNEVVVYKGQIIKYLYIIEKGNCTTLPRSGGGYQDIRSTGYLFGLPEMVLGKPSYHTVITTSSSSIMVLPINALYESLKMYPAILNSLSADIENRYPFVKSLPTIQTSDLEHKVDILLLRPTIPNFIRVHVPPIGSAVAKEYYHPFTTSNLGFILKYVLMNIAINPTGKFYFAWESFVSVLYCIFAYFVPLTPILRLTVPTVYVASFASVFVISLLDIFIKAHLGYFDEKGLLIIHPIRTFQYYTRHDFLLDIITIIPFVLVTRIDLLYIINALKLVRTFKYLRTIEFKIGYRSSIIALIKYWLTLGTLANIMVVSYIQTFCDTGDPKFTLTTLKCNLNPNETRTMEISSVFYFFQENIILTLQHFQTTTSDDECFLIKNGFLYVTLAVFILTAFLLYKSVVVADQFSDHKLNFKNDIQLKSLESFLKRERVSSKLIKKCSTHYNKVWRRDLGISKDELFSPFEESPLGSDILFDIYGASFAQSHISDGVSAFYKNILNKSTILFFVEKSIIAREGDVCDTIYMVHTGYAYAYENRNQVSTIWAKGDMFGALRSVNKLLDTIVAQVDMEVIAIKRHDFFFILDKFDVLKKKFEENLTKQTYTTRDVEKIKTEMREIEIRKLEKNDTKVIRNVEGWRVVLSLVIYLVTVYIIGHFDTDKVVTALLYAVELVRLVLVYIYHSPWERKDAIGLNDRIHFKTIRRSQGDFMYDVIATFPADLIYLIATRKMDNVFILLKLNRVLEMKAFYDFKARNLYRRVTHFTIKNSLYDIFLVVLMAHLYVCFIDFSALTVSGEKNSSFRNKFMKYYLTELLYLGSSMCLINSFPYPQKLNQDVVQTFLSPVHFLGHLIFALISREFYKLTEQYLSTSIKYTATIDAVKEWIRKGDSDILKDSITDYYQYIWYRKNGVNFPQLLLDAPMYIKAPVLDNMYRHILESSDIFKELDHNLLRQMCLYIEYDSYTPGDIIDRKTEISWKTYFILRGKVECIQAGYIKNAKNLLSYRESVTLEISEGDSFRVLEGLTLQPSIMNYRSLNYSTILSLDFSKWRYLLEYFPDSKRLLDERIATLRQEQDETPKS